MRKALVLILAAVFVLAIASVAYATDPADNTDSPFTFVETPANTPPGPAGQYNANIPTSVYPAPNAVPGSTLSGASAWTYQDTSDAGPKYEGSYAPFGYAAGNLYLGDRSGPYEMPHGGYGSTSDKCKVCHAVHRAEGAFMLLRTDTADDACSYCHIGDHRHSVISAYWQAGGNIRPANGHSIGSGKTIPDSSVWQWVEDKTLTSVSLNEPGTETISVRRYEAPKNKIMRLVGSHGAFKRVGPEYLRCQSCHQPHNAEELIWKPYMSDGTVWTEGYKLLRLSPSGGVAVETGYTLANGDLDTTYINAHPTIVPKAYSRLNFTSVGGISNAQRIKAVDSTYTNEGMVTGYLANNIAGFGSANTTGYTRYLNYNISSMVPGRGDYGRVEEVTMAVWCADCHNLNIAGKEQVATNWGGGGSNTTMLSDRSHASPMSASNIPGYPFTGVLGSQCYSCHNNDMPRANQAAAPITYTAVNGTSVTLTAAVITRCGACHIPPSLYRAYKQTYGTFQGLAGGDSLSDFPHAGPDVSHSTAIGTVATEYVAGSTLGVKLLNAVDGLGFAPADVQVKSAFVAGQSGLDKVCRICHAGVGVEN